MKNKNLMQFLRFPRLPQRGSLWVSPCALPAMRGTVPASGSKPAQKFIRFFIYT